jgi:hypothetical protein
MLRHANEVRTDSVLGWVSPIERYRWRRAKQVHQQGGSCSARQWPDTYDREHTKSLAHCRGRRPNIPWRHMCRVVAMSVTIETGFAYAREISIFCYGTAYRACDRSVNQRKPDRAAFNAVVSRIGVPAGRILFFDDGAENVAGAQAAGLQAVHVTSPRSVRSGLRSAGLTLSDPS